MSICNEWVPRLEDVEKKQGAPVDRQLVARKGAKSRRRVIGRNHSFRVAAEGDAARIVTCDLCNRDMNSPKKDTKIIIHSRWQPASQRGNRVIYLLSYELPLKIFSSQSAPSKITWYQLQRARTKLIKGLFTLLANETCKLSNIVSISNQIRRVMTELIMRSCTFLQYSVHDARDGFCAKSLKVIAVEARSGWTGTTHATEPL